MCECACASIYDYLLPSFGTHAAATDYVLCVGAVGAYGVATGVAQITEGNAEELNKMTIARHAMFQLGKISTSHGMDHILYTIYIPLYYMYTKCD